MSFDIYMTSSKITACFGKSVFTSEVEALFSDLNTLYRPELPDGGKYVFHDWVLVRRQGVELGFTDAEYQSAADRFRWGHGELLLTQAYFYSGFDDIQPYTGELPIGLDWNDGRQSARAKLSQFEPTRHSYLNDTWDVGGYRLSVTYTEHGRSIDRVACRVLAAPIPRKQQVIYPDLPTLTNVFGTTIKSQEFLALWHEALTDKDDQAAREDGQIDLTQNFGATLTFAASSTDPVFRSITLHRNRDKESVGWGGSLPQNLDFEDSPEILFRKIASQPVQQSDASLTGHAVWHFDDYTLHVLYSNIDNRLLRVTLIAPGTWKCTDDAEIA